MTFRIDPASPLPASQQLKKAIMLDILSGRLLPGDKLPAIRELAKIMNLNPGTVAKAYAALVEEGMVESRVGSGYKIKPAHSNSNRLKHLMVEDQLKDLLEKALSMGFSKGEIMEMVRALLEK